MNNDTYTPCTKCGRPMAYCKGQCCGQPKGCQCKEYGPKVCGAIRPGEPACPYQAVIPTLTFETSSNLKDLADCFVHVLDINTTFYIDDKHRMIVTWAGPVETDVPADITTEEQWVAFIKSFKLRGQFLYVRFYSDDVQREIIDAFYFDKAGRLYRAGEFEEITEA